MRTTLCGFESNSSYVFFYLQSFALRIGWGVHEILIKMVSLPGSGVVLNSFIKVKVWSFCLKLNWLTLVFLCCMCWTKKDISVNGFMVSKWDTNTILGTIMMWMTQLNWVVFVQYVYLQFKRISSSMSLTQFYNSSKWRDYMEDNITKTFMSILGSLLMLVVHSHSNNVSQESVAYQLVLRDIKQQYYEVECEIILWEWPRSIGMEHSWTPSLKKYEEWSINWYLCHATMFTIELLGRQPKFLMH